MSERGLVLRRLARRCQKMLDEGKISRREKIVCVCTGHVLKDPDTVIANCGKVLRTAATVEDVRKVI